MKTKVSISQLLRWRLSQAEAGAPPKPRAARLLESARPCWETWPEPFAALVGRLSRIQITGGHAVAEPRPSSGGFPVPALVVMANQEIEASVTVSYLNVRNGLLMLCFRLDAVAAPIPERIEVTLVADPSGRPLLLATATSVDAEYRIDAKLPAELAHQWEQLKVTDRMPFRLLLRSNSQAG